MLLLTLVVNLLNVQNSTFSNSSVGVLGRTPSHYGPAGFEIIYFFSFYVLKRGEILSEFRFIKGDFRKNVIKCMLFKFLYWKVTFYKKIAKIKNQKF